MKRIFLLVIFIISLLSLKGQNNQPYPHILLSDTAQISLLTSTPWDKVPYALFGHTAIRINDPKQNIDVVYNYGIFSFGNSVLSFSLRFIKGNTYYIVAAVDYPYYLQEYEERGVAVIEQVFNLTQEEKQAIYNALVINALPQNREYLYNYLEDNCSTRPRDIIQQYVHGTIEYTPTNKQQTYRDLIHECVDIQPWTKFGIDLIIGAGADTIITDRQKDFLPIYLMNAYDSATIKNDSIRPLISYTHNILNASPLNKDNSLKPIYAGLILLIITILLSLFVYKKNWTILGKIYDTLLFLVAGLGGCIIFYLMFFSIHPCVDPNWNLTWLNPLQLIVAFLFFVKPLSKFLYYYHFINFVALLIFLLAWSLIPQQLDIAFIPFILSIMVRSGMNILHSKKLKKRTDYSLPKPR